MQLPKNEYGSFYEGYISHVQEENVLNMFQKSTDDFLSFIKDIPDDKFDYRYDEGKWSIKELLKHLIDTERIMSYRALRVGRGDQTALPGFSENDYVAVLNVDHEAVDTILEEWQSVRTATVSLFKSFKEEDLKRIGKASGFPVSVRALAYIIAGHQIHHLNIIKERYL